MLFKALEWVNAEIKLFYVLSEDEKSSCYCPLSWKIAIQRSLFYALVLGVATETKNETNGVYAEYALN